jgi:hypothetical protein
MSGERNNKTMQRNNISNQTNKPAKQGGFKPHDRIALTEKGIKATSGKPIYLHELDDDTREFLTMYRAIPEEYKPGFVASMRLCSTQKEDTHQEKQRDIALVEDLLDTLPEDTAAKVRDALQSAKIEYLPPTQERPFHTVKIT